MFLHVGGIITDSQIYGPGSRYTIWLQGCSIRCKGCWNKQFWDFQKGTSIAIEEILDEIKGLKEEGKISGVTILGGEPLDQKENLIILLKKIKSMNLGIMIYTGYELVEIELDPIMKACMTLSDIIVVGRYIEDQRSLFLKWRGSFNQKIIVNNPNFDWILQEEDENEIEIHIEANGQITIVGYPDANFIEELRLYE